MFPPAYLYHITHHGTGTEGGMGFSDHDTTPSPLWPKVWRNLHAVWSSEDIKSIWFMVIHDLIPTNDRLAKIQRSESNQCPHCNQPDTLIHRLTECSEGTDIWKWTRFRKAIILRTDPQHIQPEWIVRPSFHFWPPQRQGAILWILAHMVYYRIQHRNRLSPIDYADFMRRAPWKAYQTARRREQVGNYLEIL